MLNYRGRVELRSLHRPAALSNRCVCKSRKKKEKKKPASKNSELFFASAQFFAARTCLPSPARPHDYANYVSLEATELSRGQPTLHLLIMFRPCHPGLFAQHWPQ